MANPGGPEGGVITSIATTITIGSNPSNSGNISNSGDHCSMSHTVSQPSSVLVGVGDNNTFRPVMAAHQSPSLSHHQITKSIDLSDQHYVPHIDKYTSLPRPGGAPHHLSRPSSRYIRNISYSGGIEYYI